MMKYFAIRPVRNISENYAEGIEKQIHFYREQGHEVYDPITDTDQNDQTGYRICKDNLQAIKNCDCVLFMWDGKSQGCLFDLGMAFALGKPVKTVIGYVPPATQGKSFQNMVWQWEESEE
jgi:nucleoside 2-deoxyribosyltransferase